MKKTFKSPSSEGQNAVDLMPSFSMWRGSFLFALVFMLTFNVGKVFGQTDSTYIEGYLLVRVQTGINLPVGSNVSGLQSVLSINPQVFGINNILRPFMYSHKNDMNGGTLIAKLERTYAISFNNYSLADSLGMVLSNNPNVELVERVPRVSFGQLPPNDPSYLNGSLGHLGAINAYGGWQVFGPNGPTNSSIIIAIVDTGVRTTHQDLQCNLWLNSLEIPNNGIDDDNNGYIDDVNGANSALGNGNVNPTNPSAPFYSHGTHCAGIAGACSDNNIGIASAGFRQRIMGINANDVMGNPTLISLVSGVVYATNNGANVISMSWATYVPNQTLQAAIDVAYLNNIVLVAAAGNNDDFMPSYPAAYDHVIAVAATNNNGQKACFSNFGDWVDISAPGVDILSTVATGNSDYLAQSGTSMACPMVAGVIGLMLQHNPSLSVDEVTAILKTSATNIDNLNPNAAGLMGAGLLNAQAALNSTASCNLPIQVSIQSPTATYIPLSNGNVTFTSSASNATNYQWIVSNGQTHTVLASNTSIASYMPLEAQNFTITLVASNSIAACRTEVSKNVVITSTNYSTFSEFLGHQLFLSGGKVNFNDAYPLGGGGYVVTGLSQYTPEKLQIARMDDDGGLIWQQELNVTVGNSAILPAFSPNERKYSISEDPQNQQLILCGVKMSASGGASENDIFISILNTNTGQVVNTRQFSPASGLALFPSQTLKSSQGYIILGNAYHANADAAVFMIKLDNNLNMLSYNEYNDPNNPDTHSKALLLPSGDMLLTMNTSISIGVSMFSQTKGTVLLINAQNNIIWSLQDTHNFIGCELSNSNCPGFILLTPFSLYQFRYTNVNVGLPVADGEVFFKPSRGVCSGPTNNETFVIRDITKTPDGYFLGFTSKKASSIYMSGLIKIDNNLARSWSKYYSPTGYDLDYSIGGGDPIKRR